MNKQVEAIAKAMGISLEEAASFFKDPVEGNAHIKEGELVLRSIERRNQVVTAECKHCRLPFQTNYYYNRHCSETCLKKSLENVGLIWNPNKSPEERWGGVSPGVIKPATLKMLKAWAKEVLEYSDTSEEPQEEDSENAEFLSFFDGLS